MHKPKGLSVKCRRAGFSRFDACTGVGSSWSSSRCLSARMNGRGKVSH